MFKKKHNIPPRPKPPVMEQVFDDINSAPEDDVVFKVMTSTSGINGKTMTVSAVYVRM
jgi:hypothetical protein